MDAPAFLAGAAGPPRPGNDFFPEVLANSSLKPIAEKMTNVSVDWLSRARRLDGSAILSKRSGRKHPGFGWLDNNRQVVGLGSPQPDDLVV